MSGILQGKTAVIAGIANRWSLAYAIAESFSREGASLVLTYVNEKQRDTIASITTEMPVVKMIPLDVTKDEDIQGLADGLKELNCPIDILVHRKRQRGIGAIDRGGGGIKQMPDFGMAAAFENVQKAGEV